MSNMSFKSNGYDLLQLHKCPSATNLSQFCDFARSLDVGKLADGYKALRSSAPRRQEVFFMPTHDGKPGSRHTSGGRASPLPTAHQFGGAKLDNPKKAGSNRVEEHLAMALCNDFGEQDKICHPGFSALKLLDYQIPLKNDLGDTGVGKVDLFAAIDVNQPCVIELKVDRDGQASEAPLKAFLEGLAYCAIVEANIEDIVKEKKGSILKAGTPHLMVMATWGYWNHYEMHRKVGDWKPALRKLAHAVEVRTGVKSHFVSLGGTKGFCMGSASAQPRLRRPCTLRQPF